jgi:hypothetical protein
MNTFDKFMFWLLVSVVLMRSPFVFIRIHPEWNPFISIALGCLCGVSMFFWAKDFSSRAFKH